MDMIKVLAQELSVGQHQVKAAVELIDSGCTIPFIARYRKEATGALNDEVLRSLDERLRYLRGLEEKKQTVISTIEEQGKMTDELRRAIEEAMTLVAVEDLYRPYKPKRRTRAMIAKERGLEGLAAIITLQQAKDVEKEAAAYVKPEKEVPDTAAAIGGAMDIIAESISDDAAYRTKIRDLTQKEGKIASCAKDPKAESVYENYYEYEEPVGKVAGHRVLALNRGEKEKILSVSVEAPVDKILQYLEKQVIRRDNPATGKVLKAAIEDSYKRLIAPSIEREVRSALTETAEDGAIHVFGKNLRQLLMQPPIAGKVVLGWDPAFRTGCKLAVSDPTGRILETTVIYPTAPTNEQKLKQAEQVLKRLITTYGVELIALGNGTASRESEQFICEFLKKIPQKIHYVIVNESGASVYSASKLATEEFPNLDVGGRSSASMARRLQDPLSELVKIDPKSIGVGQYQHDLDQKKLSETLGGVVEDCVNAVGVDLNTASPSVLGYISGISKQVAANIVAYREENGAYKSRNQLLKVPKLGPKAYEQCAGFLRIRDGKNPLDNTAVHPESYAAAKEILKAAGVTQKDLAGGGLPGLSKKFHNVEGMADKLGIGVLTFRDILKELEKPGRDPRSSMPSPILRSDVLSMEDLKEGMVLKGTVRNIIDFGAFVDIGVHQDGLVHISQMSDKKFVKDPMTVVSVGDVINVKVLSVDLKKGRISLSMKGVDNE